MKKPYTIEEIRRIAAPIAKAHGVKRMGLFGSYARGEANEESDVDFLIDKGKVLGLIKYFTFVYELEDALNCHVDVVTTTASNQKFINEIQNDEVVLYEEQQ